MATIKEVKRLVPLPLARVLGLSYALISLVAGLTAIARGFYLGQLTFSSWGEGSGYFFTSLLMFPAFYGVAGFVAGLLLAFLYNTIARIFSGVKLTVE